MGTKKKPKRNRRLLRDTRLFFYSANDDAFKAQHPIKYRILAACVPTTLLLPMIVYLVLVIGIYPAPDSGWLLLGMAGAFVIGIGFASIVAARLGQYLGHLVTCLCIGVGVLMVGASALLLYNRTIYDLFDKKMVDYYFINILMLGIPAIYYVFFRAGVNDWLRVKGINKSSICEAMKGMKNYWWYEEINRKYRMGILFNINRLFSITYPLALFLHFLLGWIKVTSIPVSVLFILACVLASLMSLFSNIQSNKRVHGRPFVLFAPSENGGIDSFVLDLAGAALPLGLVYVEVITVLDLWQLP